MRRRIVLNLVLLYAAVTYSVGLVYITETMTFGADNPRKYTKTEVAISWMLSPIVVPCVYGERLVNQIFPKSEPWHRKD